MTNNKKAARLGTGTASKTTFTSGDFTSCTLMGQGAEIGVRLHLAMNVKEPLTDGGAQ